MAGWSGVEDDGPCWAEDVGEVEDKGDEVWEGAVFDDYCDVLCSAWV